MASTSSSPFSRARLMTTLTTVQHTSALVFGTFLFVHLAAPSTAVVAGSGKATDLATKTMILGRVYYANAITEPVIVYGAAAIHIVSGLAKRLVRSYERMQRRRHRGIAKDEDIQPYRIDEAEQNKSARSKADWSSFVPSVHTTTGILLAPALAVHVALNRLVPSRSTSPINELSPSELDYSFVTYGLEMERPKSWRFITVAMYALLLGAGSVHVVAGTDRIAQRSRARRTKSSEGSKSSSERESSTPNARKSAMAKDLQRRRDRKSAITAIVSMAGASWLAIGIARMLGEGSNVSGFMMRRVDACYAAVWPYSMVRS